MRFSNQGLTIWYDTPDTPAAMGAQPHSNDSVITIGAAPSSPCNSVIVRYRVNGGSLLTLSAILDHTDFAVGYEYYRATFSGLPAGATVEYIPMLFCSGRQTPDVPTCATLATLPSSFRTLGSLAQQTRMRPPDELSIGDARFAFTLDYLFTLRAQLDPNLQVIGPTPEGLKINWYVLNGKVDGPCCNGVVRHYSGDWMNIRPDGVGEPGIRATIQTGDGALIYMTAKGIFDLGPHGYRNTLHMKWPDDPLVRITPLFYTDHPHYNWLNRAMCIGIGVVKSADYLINYDVYAVR